MKAAPKGPNSPEPGLQTVNVELIDEPFWEPGKKNFRNINVRYRLFEDPMTATTWMQQLWAEFFELWQGKGVVLNSDVLAAMTVKMGEIEAQREADAKHIAEVGFPIDPKKMVKPKDIELMYLKLKDGKLVKVEKTTLASQVPAGSTPAIKVGKSKSPKHEYSSGPSAWNNGPKALVMGDTHFDEVIGHEDTLALMPSDKSIIKKITEAFAIPPDILQPLKKKPDVMHVGGFPITVGVDFESIEHSIVADMIAKPPSHHAVVPQHPAFIQAGDKIELKDHNGKTLHAVVTLVK